MKLTRITIAANDMPKMIAFYNAVFGANLAPIPNTPLVRGTIAGIELVLCPNEIAQVVAEQNRKQLHFAVPDLDAMVKQAQDHLGSIRNQSNSEIGIVDPDGNTIVLVQL